jgi:tryptophan synthase alpha chain
MSRIAERMRRLRGAGERALVPFITAGDPSLAVTRDLVLAMAEAGADVIELGVPFSDPVADGPTIQRSSERGVAAGATLRRVLALVGELRPQLEVPLVLMGYANPFFAMGPESFAGAASEVGVDGVIVPDLPPEEGGELFDALAARDIDAILLAAPTTPDDRMAMLAERTRGFLYYLALTGVTGARSELASGLEQEVAAIRKHTDGPICVGFGISTPEQAAQVGKFADGVVVGSAIVDRLERANSPSDAVADVAEFVAALKEPLRRPR